MGAERDGGGRDLAADERREEDRAEVEDLMGATAVRRAEAAFPVEGVGEDSLEFLESRELRAEETDDPDEAAEEGMTYVPPTDPPVTIGADRDLEIAAGFGSTATDEPYDADHHAELLFGEDEVTERVLEALRADSLASGYVDDLLVDTDGAIVRISGVVDDIEDEEQIMAVASEVTGVREVISRIRVLALD